LLSSSGVGLALLAQGVAMGMVLAAPVGPVNLLCIRHTLARGVRVGLMTGLGAALADTLCAALVAGGFMVAEVERLAAGPWLRTAAGVLLLASGLRSLASRTASAGGGSAGFAASFALAASNPMLLVSVGAIVAAFDLGGVALDARQLLALVAGVALGSLLWWLALTSLVGLARGSCPLGLVRKVERICGMAVMAAGIAAVGSAWIH
jgi:putative LysE/RhtB family amino acid efflux pump